MRHTDAATRSIFFRDIVKEWLASSTGTASTVKHQKERTDSKTAPHVLNRKPVTTDALMAADTGIRNACMLVLSLMEQEESEAVTEFKRHTSLRLRYHETSYIVPRVKDFDGDF